MSSNGFFDTYAIGFIALMLVLLIVLPLILAL